MVKKLSDKRARSQFSTLLGQVHGKKDTVIVEKQGKPVMAMIDFERYQALTTKRDRLFNVVDRIWAKNRSKPARQAYRDATEAVTKVRGTSQARRRRSA